ncbi:MAG: aminotransferase class V-fold PLP-dependent enzyme [Acidobacteria bacterium]|nr:aminotransferase class V-fold PLP-dependent enzyme [Acidobacteriota bacterium]
MRAMAGAAVGYLVEHIGALGDAPAADLDGASETARRLRRPAPETGRPFGELLETFAEAVPKSLNTAGPGYFAFIPGGGLFSAALADFLATGVNRYVGMWFAAPALAQLEANVLRWMCDLFGYSAEARGILTSGGSMSNFSAIVTARAAMLPEDFLSGTIYVSDQTHHSVAKAAALAGFPPARVRVLPSTPELRMDPEALRRAVRADRAAGLRPFLVVASAGTTNTGAVDPIPEIAALAAEEGLWLHADAAYGGFFQLTARGRARLAGIERADSITLDPHKGLFLPYGTGALIVRDGASLKRAHHHHAEYLQDLVDEGEALNFAEYSPELSRDFRGLRVWLPLELHGTGAFRASLDEKLDLARLLHDELRRTPGFELPWEPDLSAVAFRYRPASGDPEGFNRRLLDRINASGRIYLSSTVLRGRFTIRACLVSHRTHRDRVEEAVEIIRRAALGE